MRIHSDILTGNELRTNLYGLGCYLECSSHGSRKRARAFEVHLSHDRDDVHRYACNPGTSYPSREREPIGEVAATWDDWGVWIDRLFDLDQKAIIGQYDGRQDFIDQTLRFVSSAYFRVGHKYDSVWARGHTAPWLD
jgi:hypothetical protein